MRNPANNYYSADQDIHFKMTTPREEFELFRKAKEENCEKSRTFIIHNHLLFAMQRAERSVARRLPKNEVVSAANFAVMKAYERFDYRRGYRFTTYLRPFIKGEISALWKSKFSGGVADPSVGGGAGQQHNAQQRFLDDKGRRFVDQISSDAASKSLEMCEDHAAERIDLDRFNHAALSEAMKCLSKKDQALIRMTYVQGLNFAQIGKRRGVTRAAVQATHAKIMRKLRRSLKKAQVIDL